MTTIDQISRKITFAVSALALSLVLISGTVSVPAQAQSSTAYVGAIA